MARMLKIGMILIIPLFWLCAPKGAEFTKTELVPLYEKEESQISTGEIKVEVVRPEAEPEEPEIVQPTPAVTIPGFRVQIGAFTSQAGAEARAAEARTRFTEQVYVEHIYPHYKVRIGNCATRTEAELLKQKAISLGYYDAWIVSTQIESR